MVVCIVIEELHYTSIQSCSDLISLGDYAINGHEVQQTLKILTSEVRRLRCHPRRLDDI